MAPEKDRRESDRPSFGERRVGLRLCGRVLKHVGPDLVIHVRVHPAGSAAKPRQYATTEPCKRCGAILEVLEERVQATGSAAA